MCANNELRYRKFSEFSRHDVCSASVYLTVRNARLHLNDDEQNQNAI